MGIRDLANEAIDLEKKQDALEKKKAWNLNSSTAVTEVSRMLGVPAKTVLAYSQYKDRTEPWGHRTTLQVGDPSEEIYVQLSWHKETQRDNWGGTRITSEGWVMVLTNKEGYARWTGHDYRSNGHFTDLAGLGKALDFAEKKEAADEVQRLKWEAARKAKEMSA